ncbi:MAG: hypothetical protein AVDCRST_MAG87-2020, partial [uncultured Thermomicrobiales bacterium]
ERPGSPAGPAASDRPRCGGPRPDDGGLRRQRPQRRA